METSARRKLKRRVERPGTCAASAAKSSGMSASWVAFMVGEEYYATAMRSIHASMHFSGGRAGCDHKLSRLRLTNDWAIARQRVTGRECLMGYAQLPRHRTDIRDLFACLMKMASGLISIGP